MRCDGGRINLQCKIQFNEKRTKIVKPDFGDVVSFDVGPAEAGNEPIRQQRKDNRQQSNIDRPVHFLQRYEQQNIDNKQNIGEEKGYKAPFSDRIVLLCFHRQLEKNKQI